MEEGTRKIVFLIEEDQLLGCSSVAASTISRHIQFCIFRLLNYYRLCHKWTKGPNDRGNQLTSSDTQWGYKIYNAHRSKLEYNMHTFYDLSISNYDILENCLKGYASKCSDLGNGYELKDCTNHCRSETHSISVNGTDKATLTESANTNKGSSQQTLGSYRVNKALSELITDFQWDKPDLMSPERSRGKGRARISCSSQPTTNYIFHISPCPFCLQNRLHYFGSKVPSTTDGLELTLIPRDLTSIPNVRLFWINTGSLNYCCSSTSDYHKAETALISDVLHRYRGSIFPITSVSHWWSITPMENASLGNNTEFSKNCSMLDMIPLSAMLNMLLQSRMTGGRVSSSQQCTSLTIEGESSKQFDIPVLLLRNIVSTSYSSETYTSPSDSSNIETISIFGRIQHIDAVQLMSRAQAFYCTPIISDGNTEHENVMCRLKEFSNPAMRIANTDLIAKVKLVGSSPTISIGVIQPWESYSWIICVCTISEADYEKMLKKISPLTAKCKSQMENETYSKSTTALPEKTMYSPRSTAPEDAPHSKEFSSLRASVLQGLEPWFCHLPTIGVGVDVMNAIARSKPPDVGIRKREYQKTLILGKLKDFYHSRRPTDGVSTLVKNISKASAPRGLKMLASAQKKFTAMKVKRQEETGVSVAIERNKDVDAAQELLDIAVELENIATANNVKDLATAVQQVKELLVAENVDQYGKIVPTVIESIAAYFKSSCSDTAFHEDFIEFLQENLLLSSKDLKVMVLADKSEALSWHIVQTFLWIEVTKHLGDEHGMNDAEDEIVKILQSVSFLQSPEFVVNFVRLNLYKRYCSTVPRLLRSIYDGLMLEPPEALLTPSKTSPDNDPFDRFSDSSVVSASVEYMGEEEEKVGAPKRSDRRLIRRFSSIGDGSSLRREISVPVKKAKTQKLGRSKSISSRTLSQTLLSPPRRKVRRDLFETRENECQLKTPEKTGSSISYDINVKNTPVHKQTRKLVWKLQQRERRRSQVQMEKTIISESPLKDEKDRSILKSPAFKRSQTFGGHSSPRRFYRLKRLPSCIAAAEASLNASQEYNNKLTNENTHIEFSKASLQNYNKFSDDSGAHSSSSLGFHDDRSLVRSFSSSDLQTNEPKRKLDFLADENVFMQTNPGTDTYPATFNEDSMDWIAMVEEDRRLSQMTAVQEANRALDSSENATKFRLPDTPLIDGSVENHFNLGVQSCKTPTQSPHIRDSVIPSPRLSASSLEILENAPILSPELLRGKRKTVSGRPFTSSRKGKRKKELPESPLPS